MYWNGCFFRLIFISGLQTHTERERDKSAGEPASEPRKYDRRERMISITFTHQKHNQNVCAALTNPICEWHKLVKCKFSKAWTSMLLVWWLVFEELFPCSVSESMSSRNTESIAQLIHTHCEQMSKCSIYLASNECAAHVEIDIERHR